jgi:hypothetical protein
MSGGGGRVGSSARPRRRRFWGWRAHLPALAGAVRRRRGGGAARPAAGQGLGETGAGRSGRTTPWCPACRSTDGSRQHRWHAPGAALRGPRGRRAAARRPAGPPPPEEATRARHRFREHARARRGSAASLRPGRRCSRGRHSERSRLRRRGRRTPSAPRCPRAGSCRWC